MRSLNRVNPISVRVGVIVIFCCSSILFVRAPVRFELNLTAHIPHREFDHPYQLLREDPPDSVTGVFRAMVSKLGPAQAAKLRGLAKAHYRGGAVES